MKNLIRYILYKSIFSKFFHEIVYFKWNRRYRKKEGFLSGQSLHDYLQDSSIIQYHSEEQVEFKKPIAIDEDLALPKQIAFYVDKTFHVSAGEVYQFNDAFLIGENAVGVTNDGQIILDTAMDLPNVLMKCSPRLLMKYDRLSIDKSYDCVVSLVHIFCNNHYVNYFHWLTDSLILLEGWRAFVEATGIKPKILINKTPNSFQRQYLNLIEVEQDDLIYWQDFNKVSVAKLVVVKSRRTGTNMDEIVSPRGLRWMRTTLSKNLPNAIKKYKKRVFLNRENCEIRRVLNFDQLIPVLMKYDFEIIDMDNLVVAEQINLFQQIEFLFAIHGAGLTNMLFSSKLTVLELIGNVDTPDDFQWYCAYYSMSQVLEFDYSYLICDHEAVYKAKKTRQLYNLIIDPYLVDRKLDKMLNGA